MYTLKVRVHKGTMTFKHLNKDDLNRLLDTFEDFSLISVTFETRTAP